MIKIALAQEYDRRCNANACHRDNPGNFYIITFLATPLLGTVVVLCEECLDELVRKAFNTVASQPRESVTDYQIPIRENAEIVKTNGAKIKVT